MKTLIFTTVNPQVTGSSPVRGAKNLKGLRESAGLLSLVICEVLCEQSHIQWFLPTTVRAFPLPASHLVDLPILTYIHIQPILTVIHRDRRLGIDNP